jgi:hypothetical protein
VRRTAAGDDSTIELNIRNQNTSNQEICSNIMDFNKIENISTKFNEKNQIKESIKYIVEGSYSALLTSPIDQKKIKYVSKNVLIGLSDFHIFVCKYKNEKKHSVCFQCFAYLSH